ncbi:unnamed protein product [Closterium sp. Naga37s-1]|nr:unnamed protein product [Closterium sp. Naga37s-1]
MVIAGAPEPSPERVAAWSAVVAKPPSVPETGTMATKPPVPPAPRPSTTDLAQAAPTAAPVPVAPPVLREDSRTFAHGGDLAGSPVPTPGSVAPPAATPAVPVLASGAIVAPPAADPGAPAPAPGLPVPPSAAVPGAPAPVPGVPVVPPAVVLGAPAPASASSLQAASATTGGPAPLLAPSAVDHPAPEALPVAQTGQPARPSRPHSLASHQERRSSRRRRYSPRRYQQQAHWPVHPGGQGDWRGPRGRGGGYRPPVTMADLQREVSRAVREERAGQDQSISMRALPAPGTPRPHVLPSSPPPVAAPPPQNPFPAALAPAASAPAPGSRLHLPPVPPVEGVEFVAAGDGSAAGQDLPSAVVDEPFQFLAEALQPPQMRVPEATLGQLHRLAESLHVLLLIQVLAHSSLPVIPPETFRSHQREMCLDAADQLAVLLAPVLAAPGGAAAAGQLGEAVRCLRRHLRAGSGATAIGASTLVVQELCRSLTGVLHALGAHRV